jgi:hypothetical protein
MKLRDALPIDFALVVGVGLAIAGITGWHDGESCVQLIQKRMLWCRRRKEDGG